MVGGWEGSTPSSFSKIALGVRLNPPRAAFSNLMYLALCLHPKISNTFEFQDDPIIRGYSSLVDYLLIDFNRCHTCGCSIFVHLCHLLLLSYLPLAVPTMRLSQGSSRLPFCLFFGRFTSPGSFWIFFSFRSSMT